jgi:hypothetical protein
MEHDGPRQSLSVEEQQHEQRLGVYRLGEDRPTGCDRFESPIALGARRVQSSTSV